MRPVSTDSTSSEQNTSNIYIGVLDLPKVMAEDRAVHCNSFVNLSLHTQLSVSVSSQTKRSLFPFSEDGPFLAPLVSLLPTHGQIFAFGGSRKKICAHAVGVPKQTRIIVRKHRLAKLEIQMTE